MKHILIYSDSAGVFGAEQINHALSMDLHNGGHRVSVAQPRAHNKLVAAREACGIVHYWLPAENLYDLSQAAPSLDDGQPAADILAQVDPDLVIFADSCPFASLAAKEVAASSGVTYLALVHCVYHRWLEDYAAYTSRLGAAYQHAHQVIAVSHENLDLLHRRFGLPNERGVVIHNGRPERFFQSASAPEKKRLRAELGIAEGRLLCLSVGRFELVKGYQYQLDALRELRHCPQWESIHFVWVGSGTLEQRLSSVSKLLAPGQVHVLGERDDIASLLQAADMLVHPAQYEGMPLVVLEAMAAGLPVIATAISGIPEALGNAGRLLANPETDRQFTVQLAGAICELASSEALRKQLGQAAAGRAREFFQESTMLSHYRALVNHTVAATPC